MPLTITHIFPVLRLTLARPDKRNALNQELCHSLVSALDSANSDPAVRVILLDAEGPAFCAGMDLNDAAAPDAAARTGIHDRLFSAVTWLRKPLVASVHATTLGGGLGLVATSHIALAAESARFALPEIRLGLWPYVIFRPLTLAMGERRTLELSLTGRSFSAVEALSYNLVHTVVPDADLPSQALDLAQSLAAHSPDAIRRALTFVAAARDQPFDAAIQTALTHREAALTSPDFLRKP